MRIGIIGAGSIGSTLAKLWVDAGHELLLASRHPGSLRPLIEELGPLASAGTASEAAAFGGVVMLAVPLGAIPGLAEELAATLAGRVVLDTANPYPQRDGEAASAAIRHPQGASGWAAAMFPDARWVKAFNTVYFKLLATKAHHRDDDARLGIPLASDDEGAMDVAAQLVRDAGFEPVVVGNLARGREFEPGTPPYNTGMNGRDLQKLLGQP